MRSREPKRCRDLYRRVGVSVFVCVCWQPRAESLAGSGSSSTADRTSTGAQHTVDGRRDATDDAGAVLRIASSKRERSRNAARPHTRTHGRVTRVIALWHWVLKYT